MDAERLQFVEDFGMAFERSGSTRMIGRVLGVLMVSDPPHLTAEQLAATLGASRGSISQATRSLVDIGLVRRSRTPGTRQDIFSVEPSAWIDATRQSLRQVSLYHDLFKRGLELMDGRSKESRAALAQSVAFMEFWERQLPLIFEGWESWMQEQEQDTES